MNDTVYLRNELVSVDELGIIIGLIFAVFSFFCCMAGLKFFRERTIVQGITLENEVHTNKEPETTIYMNDFVNFISFFELNSEDIECNKVENTSNILCSICLEEYRYNDIIAVLKCNHKYHPQCIKNWIRKSSRCPLCNSLNDNYLL